jgi:hypothetical protein
MNKLMIIFILGLSFLSTSTFAQDEGGDVEVSYKEKTEIDFEGVEVEGELVKPQGALLLERKKASFNPLIKLRPDFNHEMSQSVNDIK